MRTLTMENDLDFTDMRTFVRAVLAESEDLILDVDDACDAVERAHVRLINRSLDPAEQALIRATVEKEWPAFERETGSAVNDSPETECPSFVQLDTPRRRANALNVEVGSPIARCKDKPPAHWGPRAPSVARWLMSGGSALVLGPCSADCPRSASRSGVES